MTDTAKRRGRPPRVSREFPDTREALLRCGVDVLTEQGFASTGLEPLLARAGVPKGSFYHYFASKEAFGLAVLEVYAAYFARRLDRHFLDVSLPPLARLAAFVDGAAAGMARHGFRRGCLVGNLGQEVSTLPAAFRQRLEAVLQDWQARLEHLLDEARGSGELAASADCAALAAFFWIGWEGAVLRARLVAHENPLRLFHQGFVAGLPR